MALTNVQNEFLKMQLANNPEFKAEYFPNVITQGPVGPLYDVTPDYERSAFTQSPKTFYEEGMAAGPFSYMDDPSSAEFREVNVPYDTPGSSIDIKNLPFDAPEAARAMTTPMDMYQRVRGGDDLPITGGQASAIYMRPEMIETYGTPVTSPRGEMVPTPSFWPDQSVDYVDQADINNFFEKVAAHEVSHGVSYMPEYKGITKQATNIDFKKMFPAARSAEAQKAIHKLSHLKQQGGGLGPITEDFPVGEYLYESEYPSTWVKNLNEYDQEELYNRAKDLQKIYTEFPKNYWKHAAWKENVNFIQHKLSQFPRQFPSEKYGLKPKLGTYFEKIKPQVKNYIEKVKKQAVGMPEHLSFDTGASNVPKTYEAPLGPRGDDRPSRPSIDSGRGRVTTSGYSGRRGRKEMMAHGGLIDVPLPGRNRYI